MVLRARFRSAPALVMAPPAETTGVPSIYGDDGDSRGVWGSTRELHLRVGAHLRESRAARSDERYKTFVAYARRREEEREDAPDRGRGGEPGGTGGGEAASSANARDGARPGGEEIENAGGAGAPDDGHRSRNKNAPNASARSPAGRGALGPPTRVGGGYKKSAEAAAVDEDAPLDPRERRMPKPEPPRRWEEVAVRSRARARARRTLFGGAGGGCRGPPLLMLKAVEKAARDLGVKRTGVWTALGKPYAVEGPPTVTPPANPRAAFPRRARHPDEVADAMARRREAARAGIPIRARGDWNDDDERDEEREFGEFGSPRALPSFPRRTRGG